MRRAPVPVLLVAAMAGLVEEMIAGVVQHCLGSLRIERGDVTLDFARPWPRVRFVDGIRARTGLDVRTATEDQLREFGAGIEISLLAAVPKGSGLGTSSILAATVLAALGDLYVEETWRTDMGEGRLDMYARIVPPFLAELAGLGIHARRRS